jgi:hypothetical protein
MVPADPVSYPSQFDNLRDSWDDAIKGFHGAGRMDQFGWGCNGLRQELALQKHHPKKTGA